MRLRLNQLLGKIALVVFLLGMVSSAHAHTGHGASGLLTGLAHPFGMDHLLAIIAVGFWSARVLQLDRGWVGPAIFMVTLLLGALFGASGLEIPHVEALIALSVLIFGALIAAATFKVSTSVGLVLIGLAGVIHGFAHGNESPGSSFALYALGFLVATSLLLLCGWRLGLSIERLARMKAHAVNTLISSTLGAAGIYFMLQI